MKRLPSRKPGVHRGNGCGHPWFAVAGRFAVGCGSRVEARKVYNTLRDTAVRLKAKEEVRL